MQHNLNFDSVQDEGGVQHWLVIIDVLDLNGPQWLAERRIGGLALAHHSRRRISILLMPVATADIRSLVLHE